MENDLVRLRDGSFGFIKSVIDGVGAIVYRLDSSEHELVLDWTTVCLSSNKSVDKKNIKVYN